jgi:broad specificity phosphatase PhoE
MPTLTQPTSSPVAPAPHQQNAAGDLADAITQLNRSERGRRALVAFRHFLDAKNGSALGLDSDNQRAVETLARACRIFGAYNVRNVLPTR